jgi:hypothetical protein
MTRPLRSLRNRLTLIFALIVAGAIGIVYFYVTPRLEEELVAQKLVRLAGEAQRESQALQRVVGADTRQDEREALTNTAAKLSSSEVTVLQVSFGAVMQIQPVADSSPGAAALGDVREVAERAARERKPVTGTAPTDVGRQAASRCSPPRCPTCRTASS